MLSKRELPGSSMESRLVATACSCSMRFTQQTAKNNPGPTQTSSEIGGWNDPEIFSTDHSLILGLQPLPHPQKKKSNWPLRNGGVAVGRGGWFYPTINHALGLDPMQERVGNWRFDNASILESYFASRSLKRGLSLCLLSYIITTAYTL